MPKCDFSKVALATRLQSHFIEITLRHWFSPANLLYIFRTPFYKNTYGGLLLYWAKYTVMPLGICQTTIMEIFGKIFNNWILLAMGKTVWKKTPFINFGYAQELP